MIELLADRVESDGGEGKVSIAFHSAGIKTVAAEMVSDARPDTRSGEAPDIQKEVFVLGSN